MKETKKKNKNKCRKCENVLRPSAGLSVGPEKNEENEGKKKKKNEDHTKGVVRLYKRRMIAT